MLPKEDRAKAKANCTEGMVTFDVRAYFNVPTGTDVLGDLISVLEGLVTRA